MLPSQVSRGKTSPYLHTATDNWAKEIRGRTFYFGKLSDPQAALRKYLDEKDDLIAGRTPHGNTEPPCLRELANRFLTAKKQLVDSGELTPRTFGEYFGTCQGLLEEFGATRALVDLRSDDFERLRGQIAEVWGPVRMGNEVQRVRSVFKYACDAGINEPLSALALRLSARLFKSS